MTNATEKPLIFQKIAAVMRDIGAISKDKRNAQQGYNFRGIDDVYNELHEPMARHGIFTVPDVIVEHTEDRTTKSGGALIYRVLKIKFNFYAEDGSSVSAVVIGEGMDSGDKASNKAMAVAHKYALMQVFCIPTEDAKDPEHDSHEVAPKAQKTQPIQKEKPNLAAEWANAVAAFKELGKKEEDLRAYLKEVYGTKASPLTPDHMGALRNWYDELRKEVWE